MKNKSLTFELIICVLFLGCAAILAAAQPLKIVFVVVFVVVAAKLTFTTGLLMKRHKIQNLGSN